MMGRVLVTFFAWAVVGFALTLTRQARADDGPAIVVDVTEAASGLDPEKIRALIANELHAQSVKPDGTRAKAARGTVTIDVNRQGGDLSFT